MRILVAGGTGLLGGRLIPKLVENGDQVFALARSVSSHAKLRALGAFPVEGDLESEVPLSLPSVGAVVHAAALFRFSGPREPFFKTNVGGHCQASGVGRESRGNDLRPYQRGGNRPFNSRW
ncbi:MULTISPECIES: NAD-dependent epimerase/dehydratase family protein [Paraburkholderia]|uniref:NAD-dependent epimerase/dehydratase family protein n=1 Tax=Paraburkholderia TaxID=1822464 RepID=UPI001CA3EEED